MTPKETIARALHKDANPPANTWAHSNKKGHWRWLAAITIVALDDAGYVLTPCKPTKDNIRAAAASTHHAFVDAVRK